MTSFATKGLKGLLDTSPLNDANSSELPRARGHNKAVLDGVLQHVSASQLKTFSSCPRRWWFEKVAGLPTPAPGKSLALGTAIHAEMEAYYLNGAQPNHPSAYKVIPHIPPRHDSIIIEAELKDPYLLASGVKFTGYIDFHQYTEATREVRIIDWKSTSSFNYAKSPDDVLRDIQLGAYGQWCSMKYPQAETFRLALVYLKTKGGSDFRIVEVEAKQADIDNTWNAVETTVYEMLLTARRKNADDVKANNRACRDYNTTCPFAEKCSAYTGVTPSSLSLGERFDMALSDRLKSGGAPEVPVAVSVGIVPPDAPKPASVVVTATPAPTPAVTTSTVPGLHLYIDCVPFKGVDGAIRLEDLIATRGAEIAAANKVLDVRLIDYGKGCGLLSAHFREMPPTGVIIAQSGDLSSPVIETLIPLASLVVRGVR